MKTFEGIINLREEQKGDILIVRIEGRLDAVSSPKVEKKLFEFIDSGQIKILLDFSKLTYLSSAGMRTLLSLSKKLKTLSGKVVASNIQEDVMDVLKMTSFDHVLEITDTEEEALQKF